MERQFPAIRYFSSLKDELVDFSPEQLVSPSNKKRSRTILLFFNRSNGSGIFVVQGKKLYFYTAFPVLTPTRVYKETLRKTRWPDG